MVKPINQRYNESVVLDASGNGSVQITMRADFVLQRTRWVVQGGTGTNQATAENFIDSQPFEGTYSGDNDQSNSGRLLTAQNTVSCEWTGGRPGGVATLYLWGIEYPSGEGIPPPAAGDGPGNPIVGGQTLIRNAIQSADFVAGSTGWAIMRDGSYEFGSGGTFRGDLSVKGADGSTVEITAAGGAAEIDYTPPTNADPTVTDFAGSIRGTTNGAGSASFDTLDLRAPRPFKGTVGAQSLVSLQSGSPDGTVAGIIILQSAQVDLQAAKVTQNGTPLPGSWVAGNAITATPSGVTSGTEVNQITAVTAANTQPTFLAGHHYRFVYCGQTFTTSLTVGPIVTCRKSGTTGATQRFKWGRQNNTTITNPYEADLTGEFQVGGTNVTADVVITLSGAAGQTVTMFAATDNPAVFDIYDMGPTPARKATYLPVLS